MRRPCLLRRRWPWLGLLVVPILAWSVVLALVPTEWARARLADKLARSTGRSVRIGALRLGIFGDLRIQRIAIAEPSTPTDPWLTADEARMDVHLGQVFCGHCDPGAVEVVGASLRIWRKADGSTEIGDLLGGPAVGPTGPRAGPARGSGPVALKISGARVRIVDDPTDTRVDLADVEIRGTCDRRRLILEEFRGTVGGGTVALAAKVDRDPASPRFEAEVRVRGVEIDRGLPVLGHFLPILEGTTEGVGGKLELLLALDGRGATRAEVVRSLRGHGSILLNPIDLEGSRFLRKLDVLGDWPEGTRIGLVSTDFTVARGRVETDDLTVQVSRFPFVLKGWTDFDGRFDYAANVDRIAAKLPREAKGWLSELKVNFDQLAGLRMRGKVDRIDVTIHDRPLEGDPNRPDEERARFRDTARRLRDRFFR